MPANSLPLSPVIQKLVSCFELIFEDRVLTPEDDFFELGGDSLAAAQLLLEIEKALGLKLPQTILFELPGIADLGTAIERKQLDQLPGNIIPIKMSGNLPPIFMTHGHSGNLWGALYLARYLDEEQPLYGLRPHPQNLDFDNLMELAEQHANELISQYSGQGYRLIGYSFGGLLAFEIARQLETRGCAVSFLGIIDAQPQSGAQLRRHRRPDIRDRWGNLKVHKQKHGMMSAVSRSMRWIQEWYQKKQQTHSKIEMIQFVAQQARNQIGPVLRKNRPARYQTSSTSTEDPMSIFEQKAASSYFEYVPKRYGGNITHFSTGIKDAVTDDQMTSGWAEFTSGRVELVAVDGDHLSIGKSPDIQQVADWLNLQNA